MSQCFAIGCNSGYRSVRKKNKETGKKNPSLFGPPNDNVLLEKWKKAIRRKDRILTQSDKLCELHFEDECIERNYITTLKDGTVSIIPKGRPTLKPGSIPTLFPNLPDYPLKKTQKRKPLAVRIPRTRKKPRTEVPETQDENINIDLNEYKEFDYNQLIAHLEKIRKPNSWWTVSFCEAYVICVKWDASYNHEWKVVICQDLTAKVFLKHKELSALGKRVQSIESTSELLLYVNELKICPGVDCGKSDNCHGFITQSPLQRKAYVWCGNCLLNRKREGDLDRKNQMKVAKAKLKLAHRMKNAGLKEKMTRKCCVPRCKSNYDSTSHEGFVSTFRFPKEKEIREKWLRQIRRKNFIPTKDSTVCVKHFHESLIDRELRATRPDGTEIVMPRKNPTLKPGAYPSIFQWSKIPTQSKDPEERMHAVEQRTKAESLSFMDNDLIKDFDVFCQQVPEKLPLEWVFFTFSDHCFIIKCNVSTFPNFSVAFKLSKDLTVSVYHNNIQIPPDSLQWLLPEGKCLNWSAFDSLLSFTNNYESTPRDNLKTAIYCIQKSLEMCNDDEEEEELWQTVKIVNEQLRLTLKKCN